MKLKIEQLEPQLAQKLGTPLKNILRELQRSVPEHYQVRISLLDAKRRKKPRNASADNWSPESGRIEVRFEPGNDVAGESPTEFPSLQSTEPSSTSTNGVAQEMYVHPSEADLLKALVKALDKAESKPGWNFVPLKKFRDEMLSTEHVPSMKTDVERQSVLRSAIEKKLVLVGRVPNPKIPEFPVTTVRLNRVMPAVKSILGEQDDEAEDLDFHPVEIRGEPMSETIIRERREQ